MLINATCIAIDNKGVLIAGLPGTGKSDLALRMIDRGAQLVTDDQTELKLEEGRLTGTAPATIRGLFEIRHAGLFRMPFCASVPIDLYVELMPLQEKLERLPERDAMLLLDQPIRRLKLPSFAASTPAKIRAVLSHQPASECE